MGAGYLSYLPFDQISDLCRKYSRGKDKYGRDPIDTLSKITKLAIGSVTKEELDNLLEKFKMDILSTLSSKFDSLKNEKMKEEHNEEL